MSQKTAPFEIMVNGTIFKVEPGFSGLNVYRLYSKEGNYIIAKDFYNVWVELNRSPGASNLPVNLAGQKIDEYFDNSLSRKPIYLSPQLN